MKGFSPICICIIICLSNISYAADYAFRLAHGGSVQHQYHIGALRFAQLVQVRSDGKVKIEIFPSGKLGSEGTAAEGVRLQTIDIAILSAGGVLSHWVPVIQLLDMPYIFRDRSHAYRVLDGEIGQALNKETEKANFRNLAYWEIGLRHLTTSTKPIISVDKMAGSSIRVMPSDVYIALIKAWGANPASISFQELYDALQRGRVIGQENPVSTIRSMHLYETQKFLMLTAHAYSFAVVVMNDKVFQQLPKEIQIILLSSAQETANYQRQYVQDSEKSDLDFLKSKGMTVVQPNLESFKRASAVVYRDLMQQVSPAWVKQVKQLH